MTETEQALFGVLRERGYSCRINSARQRCIKVIANLIRRFGETTNTGDGPKAWYHIADVYIDKMNISCHQRYTHDGHHVVVDLHDPDSIDQMSRFLTHVCKEVEEIHQRPVFFRW